LQGAEFTITKPDGTKVKVTTNDKGIAELSGLAWGEYTVQETAAPQGYNLDNTVHKITIDNNNANVVQSLNVVDGAKTGTIQITKLGKDKAKLAGAQFTITAPGKEPIVITTDSNGVAEAKNLSWGTYTIKETKAPEGYTLSDKVNTVNITAGNVSEVQSLTVTDTQVLGKIQVTKTGNDNKKLSGAEFKVTGPNGFDQKISTDKNGVASLDNLAWGKYSIQEIKAPVGYGINPEVKTVTIGAENVKDIQSINVIDNQILGKLEITKTNDNGTPLEGATFTVNGPNGFSKDITTNKDGKASLDNLAWGDYTIKETKAPVGYNLNTETNKIVVSNVSVGTVQKVTVKDTATTGTVKISKVDITNGKEVAGAKIVIQGTSLTGEKIEKSFISKKTATEFTLPAGTYTYTEVSAPVGYLINKTVGTFTISKQGQVVVAQVKDERILGKLEITKTNDNGTPLEGATFNVSGPNGFSKDITTNKDGKASLDNLAWGKYTIKEIKAPNGYKINNNKTNVVINNMNVETMQKVTVVDQKIPVISTGSNNINKDNHHSSNKENHNVNKGQSPLTGDSSLFMVYMILGISIVMLIVVNLETRRKKKKTNLKS
ncbi:MAG: SpaA isopeptide-forming pilin-related protein, partial [Clostridium sp.]|uniref:SpaA isopeptide-forming pilin-related protein n=1 Tax=Clostridium sp. TaxID=1506 RepID=UPI003F3460EC